MNDPEASALGVVLLFILILIFSTLGWFNMGAYFAKKEATNETTIECIEKPNICKVRYEYLKLGEKLQENKND
jgi:Na+-transporting methylmalonyl-CoA/oxaloacetate decarboxylase gamma subunit